MVRNDMKKACKQMLTLSLCVGLMSVASAATPSTTTADGLSNITTGSIASATTAKVTTATTNGAAAHQTPSTTPVVKSLKFTGKTYTTKTATIDGQTITYRAYENIPYVLHPVANNTETISIYVPEAYFHNQSINGYTAATAPIFFPNEVGGYMPGNSAVPGTDPRSGESNASLAALAHGYVVASPAVRGRTSVDSQGQYIGKAPAVIVDLKAAVRYLHYNDARMPGDATKIISNGTSAGGAVSALLGATGDATDYEPYLKALGAASASDAIYAVSAYCPITNLDNANSAYEWSYSTVHSYTASFMNGQLPMPEKGASAPILPTADKGHNAAGAMQEKAPKGKTVTLSDTDIALSKTLKGQFPAYVNSLGLHTKSGKPLQLAADGTGSFLDYAKSFIVASANEAIAAGTDVSNSQFLRYTPDHRAVVDIDWDAYNAAVGRLKGVGAFDSQTASTGENDEFGTTTNEPRHFTTFMARLDTKHSMAESQTIRLMNPMYYIGKPNVHTAEYWRIRYGEADNNTSMAIPLLLATKLSNEGYAVDFSMPWNLGHRGDYDLKELFAWIDRIVKA